MDNKKIPEDDLTWLARNVDRWKSGYEFAVVEVCDGGFYVRWPSICSGGVTKGQWLARRAELQNKPSWADAPEWANWLGQTESGEWEWYGDDRNFPPTAGDLYWHHDGDGHPALSVGLVLGDWRDTLERRPDMNKSEPKIDTSAERVQKTAESMQVSAQDNDWFERGELPPFGLEVEWKPWSDAPWVKAVIMTALVIALVQVV